MSARRQRLHIVVTCSNRKRRPIPEALQLRNIAGASADQRATNWIRRITRDSCATVRAEDLYAGEHWQVARTLPSLATAFTRPALWVASAGWGLIPSDGPIRPYSATFRRRHADSVAADVSSARAWWDAIASWEGPSPGAARSFSDLIANHPRDRVLLVLSESYYEACGTDLQTALGEAKDGQVSVIAAGVTSRGDVSAWQLPADARLRQRLGGTRASLNVRIAADVLRTGLADHDALRDYLRRELAVAPELTQYERRRLSDDDILGFIRPRLAAEPDLSHTRLLRELRDAGMACEQGRFSELFATVARSAS